MAANTAPDPDTLLAQWRGGPGMDIDGVPWPRTAIEALTQFQAISDVTRSVAAGAATLPGDPAGMTRALHGTYAAAAWTIGLPWADQPWPTSPVTRTHHPPTGQLLRREMTAADMTTRTRAGDWQWCTGVIKWIGWVTGYPGAVEPARFFHG